MWQDPWTMRLGDLRYDAGAGLRFDTPFGLVRLDFGTSCGRWTDCASTASRRRAGGASASESGKHFEVSFLSQR